MTAPNPYHDWQTHYPEFRAFALHLTRDEERARDLLQDTIYLVLKNWRTFQEGSNFRAWVKTILRNVFLSGYRRVQRRADLINRDQPQSDWFGDAVAKNPVEGQLGADEIMGLIERLPNVNRRAFLLHYRGYRYHEIARMTGAPVGTAKSRVHSARVQLRKWITVRS